MSEGVIGVEIPESAARLSDIPREGQETGPPTQPGRWSFASLMGRLTTNAFESPEAGPDLTFAAWPTPEAIPPEGPETGPPRPPAPPKPSS